jgi:protein MpaA
MLAHLETAPREVSTDSSGEALTAVWGGERTRVPGRNLHDFLEPLRRLAEHSEHLTAGVVGRFSRAAHDYALERFHFRGPRVGHDPIRLGFFAGVHGDEPAGSAALARFLSKLVAEPSLAVGFEFVVYPIVNPTGYEDDTRESRSGKDLNREFWRGSAEPEVRLLEAELRSTRFHGLITLHADDTCEGHYGYSHGCALDDALLRPALVAAERVLPRDRRAVIDGFSACEGIICDCFPGILAPPPEQEPRPFNVIFETPARASLDLQVSANVAALEVIIATYRGAISYAQDI